MTNPQLKPCPFCGEAPEIDTRQAYRALGDGRIGDAVAIYCTGCAAQHSICLRDVPEMSREDCLAHVTELWNRRPPVEPTCAHEWKEPATRWERLERLASEFNEPKAEPLRPTYQEQQFFCESCKLAMVVSGKSDFTVVAMLCTCGHVTQVNREAGQ